MQDVKVQVGIFDREGTLLGISAPFRVTLIPSSGQLEMHAIDRPYLIADREGLIESTRINFYGIWFWCGRGLHEVVKPGKSVELIWNGPMATIEDLGPK